MKSLLIVAAFVAVAVATPVVVPGGAGPAPIITEPISVGPAFVNDNEQIVIGPAFVGNPEPIAVGPALVESPEPIAVGPAFVDNAEPNPTVQIVVNVNQQFQFITAPIPSPVAVVEAADIIPTPVVTVVEAAEIVPTPVQFVDDVIAVLPAQVADIVGTPVQIVESLSA